MMHLRGQCSAVALSAILIAALFADESADASPQRVPASSCTSSTGATAGDGAISGKGQQLCATSVDGGVDTGSKSKRSYYDCGVRRAASTLHIGDGPCPFVQAVCALSLGAAPSEGWTTQGVVDAVGNVTSNCAVPSWNGPVGRPTLTVAMVSAQVVRLLPKPRVGVAPPGGVSLVNIQTVLWLATSSDVDLGVVTLLGHRVGLKAHLDSTSWDFGDGDGARGRSAGPGRAYPRSDPCHQALCPGFFGHVYVRTGKVTVSGQPSWTGSFSVDGGGWQTIPAAVTTDPQTVRLVIKEARGVLVPNP